MLRIVAFSLASCLLVLSSSRVSAQDSKDEEEAFVLFDEGNRLYKLGQFEAAAERYERAYELHQEPTILYNLARAKESFDPAGSADAYEEYLELGEGDEDRGAIERRVDAMRERVEEEATLKAQLEKEKSQDATAPVEVSSGPGALPWVIFGAGLAIGGAGVVTGLLGRGKHNAAIEEPEQQAAAELADSADTLALVTNILWISGGVLALTGLIWGLAGGGSKEKNDSKVKVSLGFGTLELSGAF